MPIPFQLFELGKSFSEKIKKYLLEDFSAATPDEKRRHCAEVRNLAAAAGAAVTPLPIPFADIWTITPIQVAMVQAIGNIHGFKLKGKNLKAAFATVAGGWLGQQTFLALVKLGLPGAGGFAGSAFIYVWTHAIGRTAEKYFLSGMELTKSDLKKVREHEIKKLRDELKNSKS